MEEKEMINRINKILEDKNEANRLIVLTRKKVESILPEGAIEYGYNIEPIFSLDSVEVDRENEYIYVSVLLSKVGTVNCIVKRRDKVAIPFSIYNNYTDSNANVTYFSLQEINDLEKAITDESIALMNRIYEMKKVKAELEKMKAGI